MVPYKILIVPSILLSGCALLPPTEHPAPIASIKRWQPTCSNIQIQRSLLARNLNLVQNNDHEKDWVAREKNAILNDKLLELDDQCGSKVRR